MLKQIAAVSAHPENEATCPHNKTNSKLSQTAQTSTHQLRYWASPEHCLLTDTKATAWCSLASCIGHNNRPLHSMLPSGLLSFPSQKLLPGRCNSVFFACLCNSLSSSSNFCLGLCIRNFGTCLGSSLQRVPTFYCSRCRGFWRSCWCDTWFRMPTGTCSRGLQQHLG